MERPDICAECGGYCCKKLPGVAYPSDFGRSARTIREGVLAALRTGKWAIDWWEGDPTGRDLVDQAFYMRPAVVGEAGVFHGAWDGNTCAFLTSTGCELSHDDRPRECRLLVPARDPFNPTTACRSPKGVSKKDASIKWLPYSDLLKEVGNIVVNERKPAVEA